MEKMGTVLGRLLAQGSTPVAQGGLGSLAILHSASSPLAWAPGQYGGGVGQTRDDGNSTSRRGDLEAVTRPGGSSSWQWCSGELWWPTVGPTAQRGREAWVRLATQGLNQWNDEAHLGGNNGDGGSLKSSGGNGSLAASSDRRSTRVRCRLPFAWFKEGWCRGGKGGDGDARSPLKRGVVGKAGGWSSSVVHAEEQGERARTAGSIWPTRPGRGSHRRAAALARCTSACLFRQGKREGHWHVGPGLQCPHLNPFKPVKWFKPFWI
jgi:hypothetical protein